MTAAIALLGAPPARSPVQPTPMAPPTPALSEDPHVNYWIQTLASHPLKMIRKNAARQLGSIGNPSSLPALAQALKDPFYGVRQESARSLGLLGDERALSPLFEAQQKDTDATVKHAARDAIERIKARQDYQKKKEEKRQQQAQPK